MPAARERGKNRRQKASNAIVENAWGDSPAALVQSEEHRRVRFGQFFTPPAVARLIASLITHPAPILEPSAGNGALVAAIRERFGNATPPITLIERDPAVAPAEAIIANYFGWLPEATFATIIGNPPYVRAQWIDEETRAAWQKLTSCYDLPKLDARANLYLYFIADGIRRLVPGGELIFIVPRDWLKATSSAPLNRWLYRQGTITHLIDLGDARIFEGALPNCHIFRFVKGEMNRETLVATINQGEPIPDGARALNWQKRFMSEANGQLLFLTQPHAYRMSDIATVKVGAVSGCDAIFADSRHANREFVYSATVRTGKTRPMFFPDPESPPPKWLLPHKERLINRRVRAFNETNWWHWGRLHPQTDAPRIYVNAKTRAPRPFFTHPCRDFDGSVLAIFPHDPTVDLSALCDALNSIDWDELGFRCDGRFLFTQRSLENAPLPEAFGRFLAATSSQSLHLQPPLKKRCVPQE